MIMTTVVHCASCYGRSSIQPLQLFGKGPTQGNYLSLFTYRGPRYAPRPRLPGHAPNMTLQQLYRMLKLMKKETGVCRPDIGILRYQVGEEKYSEVYQTQGQCKMCQLIHKP